MSPFGHPAFAEHERILFCADEASGLRAIIAIHSTALGPAAGGCRMFPYSSDAAALDDVLRLSEAMTLKNALAGLPLGGGKSVIIGNPDDPLKHHRLRAFARHVEAQGGSYWTAEDMGVGIDDLESLLPETRYVFGTHSGPGDPSPFTVRGVVQGMRAAATVRLRRDGLEGLRVAIQGLGAVGRKVAEMLHAQGARLVVADVDPGRVERACADLGADAADPAMIHRADVDIFAPCAQGGVIDRAAVSELRCAIVAGAANNQLCDVASGVALAEKDILYAPDFLINAGGMLAVGQQIFAVGPVDPAAVDAIFDTALQVFHSAALEGQRPELVAERLARRRIRAASGVLDGVTISGSQTSLTT